MPTITIDPSLVIYQERADLDYSWLEEGTNYLGLSPSHSMKPGFGAQWDPTRNVQFAVFGIRVPGHTQAATPADVGGFYARHLPAFFTEGPHETGGVIVFRPPVGRVTLTGAYFNATPHDSQLGGSPLRCYGVAVDDFVTRSLDAPTGYALSYRGEFHQKIWGAPRRYRVDSFEYDMPHTTSIVRWHQVFYANNQFSSPNIASVINEILARPGWKSGNRLAICVMGDWPPAGVLPYEPYPNDEMPQPPGFDTPKMRLISLTLTY